ncbi:MAG: NAD(P)H-dependent oxidoreductase [Rhizobacter sp.]|nr:NAD(P)H-dependent oxidoreductase [Bacteriovorax sp.]
MKKILAISGSLRSGSKNTLILHAINNHFAGRVKMELFDGLADLPHFNPDIEMDNIESVKQYRNSLKHADYVLISTPEYAHGIPGSLKNALDWVVGSGELIDKKVGLLFSSSSEALFVQEQLIEVIRTMSAKIDRSVCLKISGAELTPEIISLIETLIS